ncbi:hypothetical protein [Chryseobacterium indoltheticum]|uniref:hypothetical protein n=1 Tax=Chryseobacterium indoltheticum TaxID=254 RepID=UPI003F49A628
MVFASKQPGIKLFDDNGNAITGDVSSEVLLWDNGTKDNTTGDAQSNPISQLNINASQLVKLNLSFDITKSEFTLTISNTSGGTANETPLSPWSLGSFKLQWFAIA